MQPAEPVSAPWFTIPQMSDPVALVVGILLMVLGISFGYKAYQAGIQGRCMYWEGFLPFTLISPFLLHLPSSKKSLVKAAEGMWVHAVMCPVFAVIGVLCLAAGADYTGLPGVSTLNVAMNGFKWGGPISVVFNRRTGYTFPIIPRAGKQLAKIFSGKIHEDEDKVYSHDNGSYQQAHDAQ
ncbi:MAG: hypothetical protein JST89_10720 [Cyanobacteria bacterium SZAS-4]|nr:hypothetical protein [Cyanobacteria bacterium SZAS-4]